MSRPGETPNPARVYDYVLKGGEDARFSLPADRAFARALIAADPGAIERTRRNREFVTTAARMAAQDGITQFADLGAGLPAEPSVHAAVQAVNARAKVVCVDSDPIVKAAWDSAGYKGVTALCADISDPDAVLKLLPLDLDRPMAVILGSVLHLIRDAESVVDTFGAAISPGSWLAVSVPHYGSPEQLVWTQALAGMPVRNLSAADLEKMLSGLDLAGAGIVEAKCWTHGICNEPRGTHTLVGAGVKPGVLQGRVRQILPGGEACLSGRRDGAWAWCPRRTRTPGHSGPARTRPGSGPSPRRTPSPGPSSGPRAACRRTGACCRSRPGLRRAPPR